MAAQAIDLSAGLVPKPSAQAAGGIDLSAGLMPKAPGNNPATAGAPDGVNAQQPKGLAYNANGEGTYKMLDPQGQPVDIPFSNVEKARAAGHRFADQGTLERYARDHAALPVDEDAIHRYLDGLPWYHPLKLLDSVSEAPVKVAQNLFTGVGAGVERTAAGVDRLARGGGPLTRPEEMLQEAAATPTKGVAQGVGEAGENIGEFIGMDGLFKLLGKGAEMLPMAEKLKEATGVASILEKLPAPIQKIIKIGTTAVRQGMAGGAQTYVKTGGDTGAALGAGATTAALGGTLDAAGQGLSSTIAKRATTLEDVGGVPTPVSADVRNARATPQQAAGQESIRNAARGSLAGHLEEVNESRAVPPSAPGLPAFTGPYEFNLRGVTPEEGTTGRIGQSAAKVPQAAFKPPQYTAESTPTRTIPGNEGATGADIRTETTPEAKADVAKGGGVLKTQDANIASAHVANLNKIVDGPDFEHLPPAQQRQILEARADAMKQLGEYHERVTANLPNAGKPNFLPVDIPATLKKTGSYTEAANQLDKLATDGYEHFNDITGGKFNAIRQANKDAWAAYKGASGLEAQGAAEKAVDETNRQMDQLMKDIHGAVSPKELSGFNDAFKNAQKMKAVAAAVDGSFTGNASSSARSWEYRGFDGGRLMSNLSRLQQRMGRGPLERVVGKDNLDTLFRVAELNRTGTARAKFGVAIKPVVNGLMSLHVGPIAAGAYLGHMAGMPYEVGGAAGWATAAATRRVMDAVLTNPKVAQNLIFAIDSGANPDHYGPMLATMIQQQETETSRERQAEESNEGNEK